MELVTRIPSSGSTYAYSFHALGKLPAVIAAWLLTLEYGISGSGVARKGAGMAGGGAPSKCTNLFFGIPAITTIKVAVVLFIIIAGFYLTDSSNLSPFVPPRHDVDGTMAFGTHGIITGASSAFFGYAGFDEVCCLAAEARNPKKIMPLAVIGVVTGTMFLSAFASLALSGMIPYPEAASFGSGFQYQDQHWAAQIVRAGETCTMPVVVLVCFLAQPRLNYALSCDGLMPRIFSKVDEKGNLFENTLISGAFFTAMAFVVPFDTLWDIVSFGMLLSFNMSMASLLMVRMRESSPRLAPRLITVMVASACLAAFLYQIGYSNEGHVWWRRTVTTSRPHLCRSSPLANFYLAAQLSYTGIYTSFAWLAASVVFYFCYGYKHSAGRSGWSALMSLPRESSLRSPMISPNKKQLQE
ncbi:hypothetical protein PInf_029437 [Phytophthora infestans]|nr:hypothetical protein PInf_029437 [Phytophthora infestans]